MCGLAARVYVNLVLAANSRPLGEPLLDTGADGVAAEAAQPVVVHMPATNTAAVSNRKGTADRIRT